VLGVLVLRRAQRVVGGQGSAAKTKGAGLVADGEHGCNKQRLAVGGGGQVAHTRSGVCGAATPLSYHWRLAPCLHAAWDPANAKRNHRIMLLL